VNDPRKTDEEHEFDCGEVEDMEYDCGDIEDREFD
jgi:hypothetical protein